MNKYTRHLSMVAFAAVIVATMGASGCDVPPKSDEKMQARQELMNQQAQAQVGMPGITNFTELKIVRKLYELRDTNVATFTYVTDMNGRLFHVCDSIGYGLPYGVQFSNPEKHVGSSANGGFNYNLPQAEPNGLFMPPMAEGTWVICASTTKKGDIEPMYVEPRVVVSPFKLRSVGEWQVSQ